MKFQQTKITKKPVVLAILDGLGVAPEDDGNAVYLANTKTLDHYWPRYPHGYLHASGTEVGLPHGVPGNSEVCHLNIGAGKIILHDLPRIDKSISNGDFFTNTNFLKLIDHVNSHNSTLHIAGLVGSGFAHSSMYHLKSLMKLLSKEIKPDLKIYLHGFTDGRDSPVHNSLVQFEKIDEWLVEFKNIKLATIIGRYFAMDRDERWDRTQKAYNLLTKAKGERYQDWKDAIVSNHTKSITDEFIQPSVIGDYKGISENDGIIFFNFRSDRALQLTQGFVNPNFDKFERDHIIENLEFVTMSKYGENLPVDIAFDPGREDLDTPLAKILSENGLSQLHISESEKFPHITYFFNGENRHPYTNETWIEIPSPRDVSTYDQKPEMSAIEVTKTIVEKINSESFDFILINYANTDMVGHTGVLAAGIKAVETVDSCLAVVLDAVLKKMEL